MSLLDAYEEGTLQTAKAMDAAPLPEPVPEPKHSAWTVVPRALAGAALEVAGNLVDVGSMIGQVAEGETRDYGDFEPLNTRPEASRPHYEMAREMRPDPLTAGLAENVIFGVGKGLTKAAFAVTAGGVIPGAAAFGLSEGMTTSEDLAEQGVDADTRQKVGTVTGVVSGASVLLPIAGTSLLKTAGLVAAGGPAAYIAQETIIKDILEEADYQKIADQHDPLDPVGLAVSTLLPAAFGAMAMRGAFKGKATQEELDAAMVHNTTIKADQFEAETPQAVEAMKQAEDSVKDIRATYEHTGDIGKVITEKLMDMGITPQEAADKGLLWDSFFKSMESKTGEDAQQLFGKYFDRVFNAGEDLPDDAVMQGKSYGFDQIQTPEFKAWSGDAPFIPREELVPVLSHMRRAILDDPKILDSIVRSVPVDMVNNLFGSEAAAKVALHDQAMLKDSSAFNADLPVSGTLGDTAYPVSLLVREVAFSAAKATRIALDAGLEPSKADSALIATNGDGFSHRGSPRAFLEFGQNNKMSIGLLASADRSSFLHESGHFFLEVMDDLARQAEAPEGLKADIQSIYDWMGVKPEQWAAMTLEEKRPFHEQWARGFEQYLMEGKAPNSRLKEAFARFRDWLIEIYKSATALNVTLSDDVRQVMDRMLTVKESEPRQSSTGDGVPPPRASIGETSAGTSDLDKALTSGEPLLDKIRPLDDPDLVSVLQDMAANEAGWAERGGNLMREFGDEGEVTGRTQWIPKAEWWPDRPGAGKANRKLNEAQVAEAVRKHMAGEPLKPLEQQTVEYMSQVANDRLNSVERIGDQEFANTMQDAHDEGLAPSTENVFDSLTVARAKEMNPQAFDEAAAAYELHDDDMIFMEQMRSIINDGIETSTQADQGSGADTGAKADPIAAEAERIVAENPERRIPIGTGPDGEEVTLSLREYIDEARAQADQARQDVNLIKAAAECLLGQL